MFTLHCINSIFIILLMSICISVLLVWISIKMFKPKITEVSLSAFAYRLFHKDFSSIVRAKLSSDHWREITMGFLLGWDIAFGACRLLFCGGWGVVSGLSLVIDRDIHLGLYCVCVRYLLLL